MNFSREFLVRTGYGRVVAAYPECYLLHPMPRQYDPADSSTWEPWVPRWYLWDGGYLAIGSAGGVVPSHAHHAIQITLGIDAAVRFRSGDDAEWRTMRGAMVRPDVTHSFDGTNSLLAMLFVDPESRDGRWLMDALREPITTIPDARMDRIMDPLRRFHDSPLEAMDPTELVKFVVASLCAGAPPSRRLDPRVVRALEFIREAETPRLSLEDVAETVFLSPSRFAHLFADSVGLPFRRYLLWRKLSRAMLAIGRGATLSRAAHEGGFSDSAHLTRTFIQMWGTPPSVLMKGEFYEIPAPFEVVDKV